MYKHYMESIKHITDKLPLSKLKIR